MGEVMSNNVQSHEDAAGRVAGEDRRADARHAARSLGSVTARIIGGSQVDLVNFSNRGVLFECDSRLLIGARASVRITTTDANLIVTGRVVRSRVKGLVNGALRYDAALILDTELGLVPTLPLLARDSSDLDDLVSFEAELEATADPSPVEAYLAESEASLLEVAPGAELPMHTPPTLEETADDVLALAPEPPPMPALAVTDAATLEVVRFETVGLESDAPAETSAVDDDSEIAFEPAVEFAFEEGGEPSFDDMGLEDGAVSPVLPMEVAPPVEQPAGESMFDATYTPPVIDDVVAPDAQFDVTPPRPVFDATPSSFFDSRRSESFGDAPAEPVVAFEAEESVIFDEAFEAAPAAEEPAAAEALPAVEPTIDDASTAGELAADATFDGVLDDLADVPAVVPDTEDRVLLQFAATVPHDLAELRRIAADNQW
jgi:hypothetical protein